MDQSNLTCPDSGRPTEEVLAQLRQVRDQAQACQDRLARSETRMQNVLALLAAGWRGEQTGEILRQIDQAHQMTRQRTLAQALGRFRFKLARPPG